MLNRLISILFTFSNIILVFGFSWLILFHTNFHYSILHDHGDIAETIQKYSPENRNFSGFEKTSKQERVRLFSEINHAVHQDIKILDNIHFTRMDGSTSPFLTEVEKNHLVDVSKVIAYLITFVQGTFFLWLCLILYYVFLKKTTPNLKFQFMAVVFAILILTFIILALGPVKVFYWLHEITFGSRDLWYFYFQDSLMTTSMNAPSIFGWIAIVWLVLFFIVFSIFHFITNLMFTKFTNMKLPID